MLQNLVSQFMGSRQGQTAVARLGQQGFSPQQSQGLLGAAVPTAAQAFHNAQGGAMQRPGGPNGLMDIGNSHYVTNFLSGAVSGLVRGQGLKGAAIDGLQGVVGGHVAQVIATRFGLPQRIAGTVGAIVTPLIIDWLFEKFGGGQGLGSMFGGNRQPAGFGGNSNWGAPAGFGGNFGGSSPGIGGMLGGLFK